jgi:translation initiation factor IF-2
MRSRDGPLIGLATVIGFSVNCSRSIQNQAKDMNVPLHLESVIYRLIEAVRSKVAALLPPVIESRVTGEATVQQLFPVRVKKDTVMVAGCKVSNGVINKAEKVRILRGPDREQIYEGTIETLRHLKKEVGEVRKGTECGISFDGFGDVKEGDEIVTFTTFEVPREL